MENSQLKLECTNCNKQKELPDNPSIIRVAAEAAIFFAEHKQIVGGNYCKKQNIFIRTFSA